MMLGSRALVELGSFCPRLVSLPDARSASGNKPPAMRRALSWQALLVEQEIENGHG